jgi:hypothetical protein
MSAHVQNNRDRSHPGGGRNIFLLRIHLMFEKQILVVGRFADGSSILIISHAPS